MHKFTLRRRLALPLAAGICFLTLAPGGAYAPPEGPFQNPLRPAQRPAVIQDVPPGSGPEAAIPHTAIPDAPPGSPTSQAPALVQGVSQPADGGTAAPAGQTEEDAVLEEKPDASGSLGEDTEKEANLSALLSGYELEQDQTAALHIRLAADSQLLELLEQGELTRADLVYLALPNGRASRLDRYSAWKGTHPNAAPEEVVFQVNLDQDRKFYQNIQKAELPDSLTVLVNKHCALPASYVPVLENLGSRYGSGALRPEAAEAFRAMADAAREDGVSLRSVSAYRSYQRQTTLYNRYLQSDSRTSVDTYSARPGHSEHQTGLALDINTASIAAHFEKTPAFAWLSEHCAEYGFILRYPKGEERLTGYRFEPWHYRYVGVDAAKACTEQELIYEEYLALQPEAVFLPDPA